MAGFLAAVSDLAALSRPLCVLEVGCGEGKLAEHLLRRIEPSRFVACDLSLDRVSTSADPRIEFQIASIYNLPHATGSFDLVVCCEVLEHLEEPTRGLHELCRVASGRLLVSTPREPLWRCLNVLRGKYLSKFGNTPGHIQHFSARGLVDLVSQRAQILHRRQPIPWTVLLAEPGLR
jgi:2-polyprenyl-3-methyl-5-hydroxy-6-metoxy-1,4-benzoquinol methylase